ncbi:MAG: hypothetical protein AAGA54_24160 [Myxococcota bacterium]
MGEETGGTSGDGGSSTGSTGSTSTGSFEDDGSTSTGFDGVVFDLFDLACEATWLDGDATLVTCPSMELPGTPSSIIRNPAFPLPPPGVGEVAPALLLQPNVASTVNLLQGEWAIPAELTQLDNPRFVALAVCATSPPGGTCTMELQVRLLRGDDNVSTAILAIDGGPPTDVVSSFQVQPQPGDTLVVAAINDEEDGTAEGLALVEPALLFD